MSLLLEDLKTYIASASTMSGKYTYRHRTGFSSDNGGVFISFLKKAKTCSPAEHCAWRIGQKHALHLFHEIRWSVCMFGEVESEFNEEESDGSIIDAVLQPHQIRSLKTTVNMLLDKNDPYGKAANRQYILPHINGWIQEKHGKQVMETVWANWLRHF